MNPTNASNPASSNGAADVPKLVDHLFRHKSGEVVSTLTRVFGPEHLDLAEDVVQETLLKALQQWPFRGVPENPGGWILQTARNHALDILRRQGRFRNKAQQLAERIRVEADHETGEAVFLESEVRDDQLRMMFTCCHPALSREARVALTLKILGGFSVPEITRAFLAEEATIAQRLVRAKRKIREARIPFEVPAGEALVPRLDSVLEVLYLLFNEGYSAHEGEALVRHELCAEAVRLTGLLVEHPAGDQPKVHALLALMLLQASRLPARTDAEGNLLLLSEQDRSLWDRTAIQRGMAHLRRAAAGTELSTYHLEAGIAAAHAMAPTYESTDWRRILSYYDDLYALNPSPVVALNRAVALSMVRGPEAGIEAVEGLRGSPAMRGYYLLPATLAEFHSRLGQPREAARYYEEALRQVRTEPERRFLLRKLAACTGTAGR